MSCLNRIIRFTIFFIFFLFAFALSAHADTAVSDSLFQAAQSTYEEGNFDGAEFAALRGLQQAQGEDEFYKLKFHLLLGYVYVARDQNGFAQREFTQVVNVNPAYELNAVETSPKIMAVFREAKTAYMDKVMSEPAIYRMPQADVRLAASWKSLVLPGWGQIYKKQNTKAAAIMSAQALSLAALIFSQIQVNHLHNKYLDKKIYGDPTVETSFNEYTTAYRTRNAVGYITLGIYALNYLDALYYPVFKKKSPAK